MSAIETTFFSFYRTNYAGLVGQREGAIRDAIAEVQRIHQTYMFPEMKTDWRTHPNNASHKNSLGCFRCHDGEHFSKSGKVISNDCNICHTTIYDSQFTRVQYFPYRYYIQSGGFSVDWQRGNVLHVIRQTSRSFIP